MPKNINSITINIILEGIEKIKTEKNDKKTVKISILARKMRHNARQSDNNMRFTPYTVVLTRDTKVCLHSNSTDLCLTKQDSLIV